MGIDIVDLIGRNTSVLQRLLHAAEAALAGWYGHVITIAGHGVTDHFGIETGTASFSMLQFLQDDDAGADRELFSSDAIALIHEETHGRLRDIDRIATDALELGGRRKLRIVDRELVVRVFGDQEVVSED